MVGGIVIGVSRTPGVDTACIGSRALVASSVLWAVRAVGNMNVGTFDEIRMCGSRRGERVQVEIGDSFWWQGGRCYWTPKANRCKEGERPEQKGGVDYDIVLGKIGFSH